MRKYFIYFMIYSFFGFLLERIINLVFLGYYHDNSVLVGPYQPLYGLGIILAIIIYDLYVSKIKNIPLRYIMLIIVAILTTGFSEFINGEGYEFLTGLTLWDYDMTFTCSYPYVCALPTSLFGVLSAIAILFIHPFIKVFISVIPSVFRIWIFRILVMILLLDTIYTFFFTGLVTNI